jgi:hypothetical protein
MNKKGNCANVHEEKIGTIAIDLMDARTISSFQDVGATLIEDPLYHYGN